MYQLPVSICNAEDIDDNLNDFVITKVNQNWVVLHFPKQGVHEFFDPKGKQPNEYGLETKLNETFKWNDMQLKQTHSNISAMYVGYYIIRRYFGKSMESILQHFHLNDRQSNDDYIIKTMKRHVGKKM